MNRTDIDWCDVTWNPVTGCKRDCPYCYAKGIAKRFGGWTTGGVKTTQNILQDPPELDKPLLLERKDGKVVNAPYPFAFLPTLHRYRMDDPSRTKEGQNIFVCSMADLFGPWVPLRWIREVMDACLAAPQHNYLFLTKFPERYKSLDYVSLLPRADNFWYGTTVTHLKELGRVDDLPEAAHRFVSIEPLMSPIDLDFAGQTVDWIIVGAETGNRKKKAKSSPHLDWLRALNGYALRNGIPILFKDSKELKAVWGTDRRLIQQFPEGLWRGEEGHE